MNIKTPYLITSIFVAVAAYHFIFAVDVKDKVSAKFSEAFPKEWVVNFDSAHYNVITQSITVKDVEFPSTGTTIDVVSFTNVSNSDVLPDAVMLSLGGVKGLPALLKSHFPHVKWENLIAATIKDGIKEKDLIGELSVRLERDKSDAVLSVFFGVNYIQNFHLKVTLSDVHPVINGSFGRLVRATRLSGESEGFVASVIDVLNGLSDSRGMNIEIGGADFTHNIVGVNSAYESLILIDEGSDIDLFLETLHQHRRFQSIEAGTSTEFIASPLSLYQYINSPKEEKISFIQSSRFATSNK